MQADLLLERQGIGKEKKAQKMFTNTIKAQNMTIILKL